MEVWATWQSKTKSLRRTKDTFEANGPKEDVVKSGNVNDGAALSYEVFMFGSPEAIKESSRKKPEE